MENDKKASDNAPEPVTALLPFEAFIFDLKAKGFRFGLETHLKVQAILSQIDRDCPADRLKLLLRPVFCKTSEQQTLFEESFDTFFKKENLPRFENFEKEDRDTSSFKVGPEVIITPDGNIRFKLIVEGIKSNLVVIGLVLLVAIIGSIFFFSDVFSGSSDPDLVPVDSISTDSVPIDDTAPINPTPVDSENVTTDPVSTDPVPIDAPPPTNSTPVGSERLTDIQTGLDYGLWINLFLLAVVLMTMAYLYFKKDKKEKRLALNAERLRKPMKYWEIDIPEVTLPLFSNRAFFNATRLLKSRESSDTKVLDVVGTIRSSISTAGFPILSYRFRTKPPEYLILIDKESYRDHQANYFESLFNSLESQEIFAVKYYYKKQPNFCWDEQDNGIDLEGLFKKHHSHRLILMGDILQLFDPFSGKLSELAIPIFYWKYRAMLTAQPVPERLTKKINSYGHFPVLQATVSNLLNLQETMNLSEQLKDRKQDGATSFNTSFEYLSEEEIIETLQENLDEITFQWLGICAVYPELNWAFTLYLGQQVLGEKALTEKRILSLIKLPWYREGLIPERLRGKLINTLKPEVLTRTRQVILNWLKNNPPNTADGFVQNEYQLYIAMEASMLDPDSKEKKEWLQSQARKPEQRQSRYKEIILRYLEKEAKEDTRFELPGWMQSLFGLSSKDKSETSKLYLYPRAHNGRRIGAKIVDILATVLLFYLAGEWIINYYSELPDAPIIFQIIIISLPYTLPAIFDGLFKGLGKRLFGLVCINVKSNRKCSFASGLLRYLNVLIVLIIIIVIARSVDSIELQQLYWFVFAMIAHGLINFALNYNYGNRENGRRFLDRVAETQVVNRSDYRAGNYLGNPNPLKEESLYNPPTESLKLLYPKADTGARFTAKFIDWIIVSVFVFLIINLDKRTAFISDLPFFSTHDEYVPFVILLMGYVLLIMIDSTFSGIGKRALGLLCISVETHEPIGLIGAAYKHLNVLVFIVGLWLIMNIGSGELEIIYLIAGVLLYGLVNVIYGLASKSGRSLSDRLAGTQVIHLHDHLSGNYQGNKSTKKPEDLLPETEEQLPHDETPDEGSVVPTFVFYTEAEVKEQTKELAGIIPDKALLIFKTSKQQTWLIAGDRSLVCLLDDAKTRSKERRLLQWIYHLKDDKELYVKSKNSVKSKRSGLVDIGNRRNWYYSLSLHPDKKEFEEKIKALFEYSNTIPLRNDPASTKEETLSKKDRLSAANMPTTNHLLVIGINDYNHIPKLNNAVRDAQTFEKMMSEKYEFRKENIIALYDEAATKDNILESFDRLTSYLTADDNLIVYFSGQGDLHQETQRSYWIPVDARRGKRGDYISNAEFQDYVQTSKARHILGIIDACYAGSLLFRKGSGPSEQGYTIPSRKIMTSSLLGIVSDGPPNEHSPFAATLLDALRNNTKPFLSTAELWDEMMKHFPVTEKTIPHFEAIRSAGHQGGDFYFLLEGSDEIPPAFKERQENDDKNSGDTEPPNEGNAKKSLSKVKKELRELVARNELDFKRIREYIQKGARINNDFVLQEGRYEKVKRDYNLGGITNDDYARSTNQIRQALLKVIDSLEEKDLS